MKHIGDFCNNKRDDWKTPKDLFNLYDKIYHFTLDPCSSFENHLTEKFFTISDDGLQQDWFGTVFMNPPYGRVIEKWVKKAYTEYLKGVCIVMLLPARTDTKWFHDIILPYADIHFLKGRLSFDDGLGRAPFPSMICILDPDFRVDVF